jgi:hypothetical protein
MLFPPLHVRLYAGCTKLFAAVSRQLFTHIVFENLIKKDSTYPDQLGWLAIWICRKSR